MSLAKLVVVVVVAGLVFMVYVTSAAAFNADAWWQASLWALVAVWNAVIALALWRGLL